MVTKEMPKNAKIFYCEDCDFKSNKLSNFNTYPLSTANDENFLSCRRKNLEDFLN